EGFDPSQAGNMPEGFDPSQDGNSTQEGVDPSQSDQNLTDTTGSSQTDKSATAESKGKPQQFPSQLNASDKGSSGQNIIWIIISAVTGLAALLFAKLYHRKPRRK
ncbi:MAG: hypothetical protein Q4F95_15725, partial [Oscillospiraceae bacterium]|nr:hypothetical protein [Oscillospiraceae bacterium]